jgi:hypothetical protein
LTRKKRRAKLPRAALKQLMDSAQEIDEQARGETPQEFLKRMLGYMDKYRDYFFSEPWPEKWSFGRATTFTLEDLDFIDENDDEFWERIVTVFMKKNISLEGINASFGMFWSWQAYREQFIKPDLEETYGVF